jgi:hypothetical protein
MKPNKLQIHQLSLLNPKSLRKKALQLNINQLQDQVILKLTLLITKLCLLQLLDLWLKMKA